MTTMNATGVGNLPEKHLNHAKMNAVGLGPKPLSSRGVVQLARAKGRYVPLPRPPGIRKTGKGAKR
jgi:hypothetical protein